MVEAFISFVCLVSLIVILLEARRTGGLRRRLPMALWAMGLFLLALLAGAALIVAGGAALAWEPLRPHDFRATGLAWAVGCTFLFASRDTFVRWFSGETAVASTSAAAATLAGGAPRRRTKISSAYGPVTACMASKRM